MNAPPFIDLDFTDSPAVDTDATYIEGQGPVTIAPLALVSDPDLPATYDGYTVTVAFTANGTADDLLEVRSTGFGPTDVIVIGNEIYYGGPVVATFTGGVNGVPLVITFNADACGCALEAVVASIAFSNVSDDPSTLDRTVTFTVDDGQPTDSSASAVATISVIANDSPVLTDLAPTVTFAENVVNATPQSLDASVVLADTEGNFVGGALTVRGLLAEDQVTIRNVGTGPGRVSVSGSDVSYGGIVIGTFAGGNGDDLVVLFNAAATTQAVEAVIENLLYANNSDAPTPSRTLLVNVIDSFGADLGASGLTGGPLHFEPLPGPTNPLDHIAVYGLAAPTFMDVDGDGDLDLVVGDAYSFLRVFDNDNGVFTQVADADNPFDGLSLDNVVRPAFVDIDGDSDLDLVTGGQTGGLQLFENDNGVFTELIGVDNPFDGILVGPASAPAFADLDGDGDLDLVVGDYYGDLHAFENDLGVFTELTGSDNPFAAILVDYGAAPTFVDLDGDGDLDLVVGDAYGTLSTFENDGGTFTQLAGFDDPLNGLYGGYFAAPAFADIDGDGDLDLVVGSYLGTIATFENGPPHGQTIVVNVTPENDAPLVDLDYSDGTPVDTIAAYHAGDPAVAIAPNAFVTDPDQPVDYDGYQIIVAFTANGTSDDQLSILSVGDGPGEVRVTGADIYFEGVLVGTFSGGANGAALVINLNSNACGCALELVTASISYATNTNNPSILDRTVTFTVDDGAATNSIASAVATINVTSIAINGTPFDDDLNGTAGADIINGLGANDRLHGFDDNDLMYGNDGLDYLYGGNGNDRLEGGAGKDYLDGEAGADTLIGGTGDDRYFVEAGDTIVEADGEGIDNVYARTSFVLAAGVSVELLTAIDGTGTDPINLTGNELNNVIQGNAGANRLLGGGGSDYLIGFGGGDVLDGGAGNDILVGGTGNDRYFVDGTDRITELAGEGSDIAYARTSYVLNAGAQVELLAAADGAATDALNLTGNELDNTIQGNAGSNVLNGGAGADYLNGLGGDDTLDGGVGADILIGGAGADTFRVSVLAHSAPGGADRVFDFVSGTDKIDVSPIDANSIAAGNQAFAFIGNAAFSGVAGQLRYEVIAGKTNVYGDVNGDGVADLHIILEGAPVPLGGDFIP